MILDKPFAFLPGVYVPMPCIIQISFEKSLERKVTNNNTDIQQIYIFWCVMISKTWYISIAVISQLNSAPSPRVPAKTLPLADPFFHFTSLCQMHALSSQNTHHTGPASTTTTDPPVDIPLPPNYNGGTVAPTRLWRSMCTFIICTFAWFVCVATVWDLRSVTCLSVTVTVHWLPATARYSWLVKGPGAAWDPCVHCSTHWARLSPHSQPFSIGFFAHSSLAIQIDTLYTLISLFLAFHK